jgi:hypothetical protein
MSIGFLFKAAAATNGDLLFSPPAEALDRVATITGSFAEVEVAVQVVGVFTAEITGSFSGLSCAIGAEYRSNTDLVGQAAANHQQAAKLQAGSRSAQQGATNRPVGWDAFWHKATQQLEPIEHLLPGNLVRTRISMSTGHKDAVQAVTESVFAYQDAARIKQSRRGLYQNATPARAATLFRHQDGDHTKRYASVCGWAVATRAGATQGGDFQKATAFFVGKASGYQEARTPPAGISYLPGSLTPPDGCYTPSGDLLFSWPAGYGTHFVFTCGHYTPPAPPTEPIIIPVRRVYIVLNSVSLRRVSDNAPVAATGFTLGLDRSSWTWGFSASLPAAAEALIAPTNDGPVELAAWVNGTEFRVLAEKINRERTFGSVRLRVSGRGRNAALDAPYAAVQTFQNTGMRTHQQLFDDTLSINGVSLGYAIDYGLEAWNVPAGVFAHQGTYISAIAALAQAGGGYLIPHPSAKSFKVRHLYPVAPWHWDTVTPDFILPAAVVTREGIAWNERPNYNRVFVSGQEQGVLGQVTRQGTAGELLAPMVTDPLITTAAAARQRGLAILGDTGRQLDHALRLPVLAETGIIQPGAFVQYEDDGTTRIGLVRSTDIEAVEVDVFQTLGVECHA